MNNEKAALTGGFARSSPFHRARQNSPKRLDTAEVAGSIPVAPTETDRLAPLFGAPPGPFCDVGIERSFCLHDEPPAAADGRFAAISTDGARVQSQ
jgi:hypothetical protein